MKKDDWISVDERLPENESLPCLVYFRTGNDYAVAMHKKGVFYLWDDIAEEYIIRVHPDHWMPLPKPPDYES